MLHGANDATSLLLHLPSRNKNAIIYAQVGGAEAAASVTHAHSSWVLTGYFFLLRKSSVNISSSPFTGGMWQTPRLPECYLTGDLYKETRQPPRTSGINSVVQIHSLFVLKRQYHCCFFFRITYPIITSTKVSEQSLGSGWVRGDCNGSAACSFPFSVSHNGCICRFQREGNKSYGRQLWNRQPIKESYSLPKKKKESVQGKETSFPSLSN